MANGLVDPSLTIWQFSNSTINYSPQLSKSYELPNSAPYFSDALRGGLNTLSLDPNRFDIGQLMRIFDWTPVPGIVPYDDAHETLDELKRRGYKIGLLTNSFFPMWMRDVELRHYDLLHYFDARITASDTDYMKPHPAIYQLPFPNYYLEIA